MLEDIKNIKTEKITFVPLGITDSKGKNERGFIQFSYDITDNNAEELTMQIRDGANIIYQEIITDQEKLKKGEDRIWTWDGFDQSGILDTAKLTSYTDLNLYIIGHDAYMEYGNKRVNFKLDYDKVKWVDVKIDKHPRRKRIIDITIRVMLTDGGAKGTKTDCKFSGGIYTDLKENCPWDDIPKIKSSATGPNHPYLEERSKTYEELKDLVLEGLNIYWSRTPPKATGITIDGTLWEVIVTAVDTSNSKISLNSIPLVYNTNNDWSRSGNPGGAYDDDSLDDNALEYFFDDHGVIQRISYNVGYIKYNNGWFYDTEQEGIVDFKTTSAHEIGHEILQAYYGTTISWQHHGTSYYLPQDKKPLKGDETLWQRFTHKDLIKGSHGEELPIFPNEINLMKYYHGVRPADFFKRRVASENDVKGLVWLTKLNIKEN